jgi:hypothetical protein
MAAATVRLTIGGAVAGAAACLKSKAVPGANMSNVSGTLPRPPRCCQPISKRSGIGDPPQSAFQNDQIHLGPGDVSAPMNHI